MGGRVGAVGGWGWVLDGMRGAALRGWVWEAGWGVRFLCGLCFNGCIQLVNEGEGISP